MGSKLALLLLCVILSTSAEDNFGLKKSVFDNLITAEYSSQGVKADIFLDHMWGKITENVLPASVITPYLKVTYTTMYDCLMETTIYPKLGQLTTKSTVSSNGRIKMEIFAQLEIKEPMVVNYIVKEDTETDPHLLSTFHYVFEGNNIVKLDVEIPDFSQDRASLSGKCLVTINSLEVTSMEEPNMDGSEESKSLAKSYWDVVSRAEDSESFFTTMSDALTKGIYDRLQKEKEFWICLSVEFKEKLQKSFSQSTDYSENYMKYCNGKKRQEA